MKNWSIIVVLSATVGCAHAPVVEKHEAHAAAKRAPHGDRQQQRATRPTAPPRAPSALEQGRPELSVSAEGLMLPEGPGLIQQALARLGYLPATHQTGTLDPETTAALRTFQSDQKVAKTGSPDRETVRKLGVPLEQVFRTSASGRARPPAR